MNVIEAIKTIKTFLGMEIKLEEMKLVDGMTIIQADSFEAGQAISILVPDAEAVPLPIGEYELEDGRILVVVEAGMIAEIKDAPANEENPQEAVNEVPVEAEAVAPIKEAKKVVEIKETHFSAEEVEALKNEIVELKAQLEAKKEVVELAVEEEVKPIQFNPENKQKVEMMKLSTNAPKSGIDRILEQVYNEK